MKARLFVCTTCDRYALPPETPTRGETFLASVQMEAERLGVGSVVSSVPCVNSCPRPAGAAMREGRGGGVFRFAGLGPQDAPALVGFVARRAAGDAAEVPESLADRVACYILPQARTAE
jgi:predicted metal-binding protein